MPKYSMYMEYLSRPNQDTISVGSHYHLLKQEADSDRECHNYLKMQLSYVLLQIDIADSNLALPRPIRSKTNINKFRLYVSLMHFIYICKDLTRSV